MEHPKCPSALPGGQGLVGEVSGHPQPDQHPSLESRRADGFNKAGLLGETRLTPLPYDLGPDKAQLSVSSPSLKSGQLPHKPGP